MVSIIIINYRQKELVLACVDSIRKMIRSPYEIIIVNNSPEEMIGAGEGINVIPNENRGFSQANNLAATQAKGEYLLFLNADTEIRNDFLNGAVTALKENNSGAMGMKMYSTDGTFQLSFWEENTFSNEKINKRNEERFRSRDTEFINQVEENHSEVTEVAWVSGAAMLMKKDVFEKVGGFDEDFFLFYEDADLCKRVKEAGYGIYFYPKSDILHLKGENVNEEFSGKTYFYAKQSQLLYYKKHNPLFQRILLRVYLLAKFGFKYLTSFKSIYLKIVLLALGLRKKP
jgi:GT2 family glycosyltransferase